MVWWYRNRAVGMKLMQSLHGKHASEILQCIHHLCPDLTRLVDFAETMVTENGNGNTERKNIRASYYTVYIPHHKLPLYFILFILG